MMMIIRAVARFFGPLVCMYYRYKFYIYMYFFFSLWRNSMHSPETVLNVGFFFVMYLQQYMHAFWVCIILLLC